MSQRGVSPGNDAGKSGIVFDIQKYTINDGPGIRSLVFLKGCHLRCLWCSNPESQSGRIQVGHFPAYCKRCFSCIEACRFRAIEKDEEHGVRIDSERCTNCFECLPVCPTSALQRIGKVMTASEVVEEVCQDSAFYRKSGGGVTVSGGEPLIQHNFLATLLQELHSSYIHTAIETTGYAEWSVIEKLLPFLDLVLYDLKTLNDDAHLRYTGAGNAQVLENFARLSAASFPLWLRLPIIPGYNDDQKNIEQIGTLAARSPNVKRICLLPYHALGVNKYARIGARYQLPELKPPSEERLAVIESLLRQVVPGIEVRING